MIKTFDQAYRFVRWSIIPPRIVLPSFLALPQNLWVNLREFRGCYLMGRDAYSGLNEMGPPLPDRRHIGLICWRRPI